MLTPTTTRTPTDPTRSTRGIPTVVTDETGDPCTITRAWPGGGGNVTFEAVSPRSPHVRGGGIAPDGTAVLAPFLADPKLPALAKAAALGTVVVHRPARRAVIRMSDGSRFIKVVREGKAQAVVQAAARGTAFAGVFRLPAIVDSTRDTVHFEAVRGRTVHDLGADTTIGSGEWDTLWSEWASAWSAAAGASASTTADASMASSGASCLTSPSHPPQAEVHTVRTWAAHARWMAPTPAAAELITKTADRVVDLILGSEPDPLVASHRDLHDKQMLWYPGDRLGLLDLDTATRAEAALDLGNLTAHLVLRHRQGLWSAARTASAVDVVRTVAVDLGVSPVRFAAYERAAAFRIACVYAFRPRWAAMASEMQAELGDWAT
jgi:hypothetical protein